MNQGMILPVAIPAMAAALLVLVSRYGLTVQRVTSVIAIGLQLAVAIWLYALAADGEIRVYLLGNWPAPFGIVLVLDRLAATMLLLAGVLGTGVLIASLGRWDQLGRHFHALFQFQLLGINGAFLTGDLFNLFVFFEVLLIASYGLMLHGGGARRLKAGFHYVAINLIGSTVFLFAVGTIYAVTGTLNMADLAIKVRAVAAGNEALAFGRCAAAVHGVRNQVGDGAAALVAAADLWLDLAASRSPVRDHDQGRRLFDHPRLHPDFRRRCRAARGHCAAVDHARRHRDAGAWHFRCAGKPGALRTGRLFGGRVDGHAADRGGSCQCRRSCRRALLCGAEHADERGPVPARRHSGPSGRRSEPLRSKLRSRAAMSCCSPGCIFCSRSRWSGCRRWPVSSASF